MFSKIRVLPVTVTHTPDWLFYDFFVTLQVLLTERDRRMFVDN